MEAMETRLRIASIEDKNRQALVDEARRHFPGCDVTEEVNGGSEALGVYVYSRSGRRVCTLRFTCNEWHDYHERPIRAKVSRKIEEAAATAEACGS